MTKNVQEADKRKDDTEKKAEGAEKAFENACRALTAAQATIEEIKTGLVPLEQERSRIHETFETNKGKHLYVQVAVLVRIFRS